MRTEGETAQLVMASEALNQRMGRLREDLGRVAREQADAPACELLARVLARLDVLEARLLAGSDRPELLRCGQVDREYRQRKGTALAHARSGSVKSRLQRRGGKDTYLIPRSECERLWGAS